MIKIIDLDGGDLGTADFTSTYAQLPTTIHLVAGIMQNLPRIVRVERNQALSYAIKMPYNSHLNLQILNEEETRLPSGVQFYYSDGMKIFDLRSASGGIAIGNICYLIVKGN